MVSEPGDLKPAGDGGGPAREGGQGGQEQLQQVRHELLEPGEQLGDV
jgi:hypothetical protein